MTDEQIVERVRSGETRHFEQLVSRYQDAVYGMARRFVGDAADAEDLAQEAFLRTFRGLESFKGDAKFSTWLYRIAWNLCADALRRARRPGRTATSLDDAGDVVDEREDVAQGLLDTEEKRRVRRAIDGLDEIYRAVVVLLYDQKLSYEQIAAVLGVPVKTVETRLYRARRQLRESLGGEREAVRERAPARGGDR
jgi:RNA polymerase sigma-70 factor (ECF subfamily)